MKYIRTKDGILTCLDTNTLKVGDLVGINEPILAKADTIPELCDEFVSKDFERIITKEQLFEYRRTNVMGAIWTEWGLKYVAKMNEKGELELL